MKLATDTELFEFVLESNAIEGLTHIPTPEEIYELDRFIHLPKMTVEDISKFVSIYQPGALLRNDYLMDVRVGNYYPPRGNPDIEMRLQNILTAKHGSWEMHVEYEVLHPYTDCNGRSGRALWAWREKDLRKGFLLNFYYQTLKRSSQPTRYPHQIVPIDCNPEEAVCEEADFIAPMLGSCIEGKPSASQFSRPLRDEITSKPNQSMEQMLEKYAPVLERLSKT